MDDDRPRGQVAYSDRVPEVLSAVSLAVSVLSIALATLAYRRAGYKVGVLVWKAATMGASTPTTRVFTVVVANAGRGGITIRDVGLHADSSRRGRVSVQRLREEGEIVEGPDLPYRLDGSDFGEWRISGSHATTAFGVTTKVHGFTEVVRLGKVGAYTAISSKIAEFNASSA